MKDLQKKFQQKVIAYLLLIFVGTPLIFLLYDYNVYSKTQQQKRNDQVKITKKINKTPKILTLQCKTFPLIGIVRDITLAYNDTIAFIASCRNLMIIDVRDPDAPHIISKLFINRQHSISSLFLSKDLKTIYASTTEGIYNIDVSNLKKPKIRYFSKIGNFPGNIKFLSKSFDENKLFVTGFDGLFIADISNRKKMTILHKYYDGIFNKNFVIKKNILYVFDKTGIKIFNVKNSPKLIGTYPTISTPKYITIKHNKAYVVEGENNIEILNITTPQNPQSMGVFSTKNTPIKLQIADKQQLYAFTTKHSIEIYDLKYIYDPTLVQVIQYKPINDTVYKYIVAQNKKHIFIAYGKLGIGIITLPDTVHF